MFTFDKSIETGNAVIDSEHKQLIDAINQMLSACVKGNRDQAAKESLNFLNQYIIKHFNHEEQLQRQCAYPELERHHKLHEGYKQVVRDLGQEYMQTGPTPAMLNKLSNNVGGWLINHIKREDARLAAYIREKKA